MNFPPGLQVHKNNRLLIWRPRGLLDEKVVSDAIAAVGRLEMELHEPFNRFSDTAGVEQVDLNYEYVISVALYRRFAYAHRKPIKSAILTTHPKFIHYAQIHALLTRGSTIDAGFSRTTALRLRNGSAYRLNCSRRSRSPTLLMKQVLRPNTCDNTDR